MDYFELSEWKKVKPYVIYGVMILGSIIFLSCLLDPIVKIYSVWAQSKVGEAELAHAEFNRKIKIEEAKSHFESAKYFAESEIVRARGVAEANRIIGESLNGNEAYLRYLWVTSLQSKEKEVIYIPTEANLPILEANRLNSR